MEFLALIQAWCKASTWAVMKLTVHPWLEMTQASITNCGSSRWVLWRHAKVAEVRRA